MIAQHVAAGGVLGKRGLDPSPPGTTPVLTQTLQRWGVKQITTEAQRLQRIRQFFLTTGDTEITGSQLLFLLRAFRASVVNTISSEFLCVSVVNTVFMVHS